MNPKVSVIIPNYNYERYLGEAIDSVLSQTHKNLEIIVVDDGSSDGSKEILESYGNKIKAVFQKNVGVSAARNHGAAESTGDYIAFLDADDIWFPEKLEKQLKKFEENQGLGLVHVGVQDIDADGNEIKVLLNGLEGIVSHEFLIFKRGVVLGGGSGVLIPKKVFEESSGFDTELSTSADWDLYYRISSKYPIGFVPEILLRYRIHGSNMHGNVPRMESEMLYAYGKAFGSGGQNLQKIRKIAYGNLHQVLATSYFTAGAYFDAVKNAAKSLMLNPRNIGYFANYPFRIFKRNIGSK